MFILNLNHPPEKISFYSDLHYGHDRDFIWGPRGYKSVAEHDETQDRNWNESVAEDGIVFLLGDTIMGPNGAQRFEDLFERLNFSQLFLMPGNHFSGLKEIRKKYGRSFRYGKKDINIIENYFEINVGGQFIVLSHYPIMSWNAAHKGSWMIHGHVHGKINGSLPHVISEGKILDVGPESVGRPVSFTDIKKIMDNKVFKKVDHHA